MVKICINLNSHWLSKTMTINLEVEKIDINNNNIVARQQSCWMGLGCSKHSSLGPCSVQEEGRNIFSIRRCHSTLEAKRWWNMSSNLWQKTVSKLELIQMWRGMKNRQNYKDSKNLLVPYTLSQEALSEVYSTKRGSKQRGRKTQDLEHRESNTGKQQREFHEMMKGDPRMESGQQA